MVSLFGNMFPDCDIMYLGITEVGVQKCDASAHINVTKVKVQTLHYSSICVHVGQSLRQL